MFPRRHIFLSFVPNYICSIGPDGGDTGGGASPGGGGSAPSSAPSAAPAPSGPSTPTSPTSAPAIADTSSSDPGAEPFDFSAIFEGPKEVPVAATPLVPAATPVPVVPVLPKSPDGVEPPKPTVEATVPVVPAPAPAVPTQPTSTAPVAPSLDPSDPSSIAAHLTQHQDAAIAHVAEQLFKLTPEDVEALETDVVGTVPKLLARTFVQTQKVILTQMARLVPAMIERQTEAKRRNSEAETEFYTRWPQIDPKAHGEVVKRYAVVYRQMHPTDTKEQMFEALGPLVLMAAKLPLTAAPAAPGAPLRTQNPQKPAPFVPARGGPAEPINNVELSAVEAMFQDQ